MKAVIVLFAHLVFLFLGVSCAPLQIANPVYINSNKFIGFSLNQEKEPASSHVKDQKRKLAYYKAFPTDNNQYVRKWLIYFSEGPGRETMKRYLERSRRYVDFMGDIFKDEGIPMELVYMAMAESGFYPYAKSPAGAVGYWQFIKSTGQMYGLRMDYYIDDRQDFVLSTQAAGKYLKSLYGIFEDWRLSMAAYNCGESRVAHAVKSYSSKNFWYLAENKALPPETRNYVPKVMAMKKIALKPNVYGFSDLNYKKPLKYNLVSFDGSSSLSHISKQLGVSYEELKALNPKFKTDIIPMKGQKSYIRVPDYIRFDL